MEKGGFGLPFSIPALEGNSVCSGRVQPAKEIVMATPPPPEPPTEPTRPPPEIVPPQHDVDVPSLVPDGATSPETPPPPD